LQALQRADARFLKRGQHFHHSVKLAALFFYPSLSRGGLYLSSLLGRFAGLRCPGYAANSVTDKITDTTECVAYTAHD
jgi:hypothetical protein